MAASRITVDSDIITLRQIYVRDPLNGYIPADHILISDGAGVGYWNSVSSIYEISSLRQVRGNNGYTWYADHFNHMLNVSTTGVAGVLDTYVDPATSTLMFNATPAPIEIATIPVPTVTRTAATVMPGKESLVPSTTQSTFKFLGVGDMILSTVTDLNATFITISTFTSAGYSTLSGEAFAWRPYLSSLMSTNTGYASFVSTLPVQNGSAWNWSPLLSGNLPLSTVDANTFYATGNAYFSTFSFTMSNFLKYIKPDSTTKLALEVHPTYFFDRLYTGSNPQVVKPVSTFIQYQTSNGVEILPSSFNYEYIVSQQTNAYTSNCFNTPLRLEMDTGFVLERAARDGPNGYYTLYHSMPGLMAEFTTDGCDKVVGNRGGLSNATFDNRTSRNNAVFLHLYNN
jgi:hypothetical protein